MVARGPGPHGGLGKPEREDPARVEGPAPGVRFHISKVFQGRFKDDLRLLQECFKESSVSKEFEK